MVTATLVRGAQDAAVQTIFQRVADTTRPAWQRAAMLRGAEVALLGAAAPGTPAGTWRSRRWRRRGAAAIPRRRAARAGPGGAPAFPREGGAGRRRGCRQTMRPPGAAGRGGRGGRGGGGNLLRLNREPADADVRSRRAGGDLGTRAAALLARIEWPGKPGASAPVPPLTAEEQQRFAAGQDDLPEHLPAVSPGRTAAARRWSRRVSSDRRFATGAAGDSRAHPDKRQGRAGRPDAAARSGVHRRADRRRVDVRPPRNGATGTPVDVQVVKDTRAAVAGRTRPWTNAELTALAGRRR